MSQYIEKYKKNIVIDMRKKGYSYSEIQNSINIPKSTIGYWLKDVKLTGPQSEKLKIKQLETIRVNSEKRKNKTAQLIAEIKNSSSKQIKEISKRELWLMGIMLYWKERLVLNNESDLRKGVNYTSSDPYLIKLFLKWLQDLGGVSAQEITFDIFLNKFGRSKKITEEDKVKRIKEVITYWADVTATPKENFIHIYFKEKGGGIKGKIKSKAGPGKSLKVNEKNTMPEFRKAGFGLLRIRVKESSMLARQIAGWVKGVMEFYWK